MNYTQQHAATVSTNAQDAHQEGDVLPNWMDANVPQGYTVAAVGDLIISDSLCPRLNAESPKLLDLLRNSDLAFGNFEGTAIDLRKFGGYPSALSGGSWLISTPAVAADLKQMGFDCVSLANNHTTDWGVEGMRYTAKLFNEAGVMHAGTGETLAQARAPQYLSTAAARVALVAIASRFEANARAINPLGQIPGRPGLNALRTVRYAKVSPERFSMLAQIRDGGDSEIQRLIHVAEFIGSQYEALTAEWLPDTPPITSCFQQSDEVIAVTQQPQPRVRKGAIWSITEK